jgi:hypothetical protein
MDRTEAAVIVICAVIMVLGVHVLFLHLWTQRQAKLVQEQLDSLFYYIQLIQTGMGDTEIRFQNLERAIGSGPQVQIELRTEKDVLVPRIDNTVLQANPPSDLYVRLAEKNS